MVVTVEPGIYSKGFGVRIENMLLTEFAENNKFVRFKTLSFVPLERKLISVDYLTRDEINWVNEYHDEVFEIHAELASRDEVAFLWLQDKTRKL
jgi:Xaa-Pro aminopeptidase